MKYDNIKHLECMYQKINLFIFETIILHDNGKADISLSLELIIDAIKNQTKNNYITLFAEVNKFSDNENRNLYLLYIRDMIIRDIRRLKTLHVSDNFDVEKFITS